MCWSLLPRHAASCFWRRTHHNCVDQTHEVQEAFVHGFEVRNYFLGQNIHPASPTQLTLLPFSVRILSPKRKHACSLLFLHHTSIFETWFHVSFGLSHCPPSCLRHVFQAFALVCVDSGDLACVRRAGRGNMPCLSLPVEKYLGVAHNPPCAPLPRPPALPPPQFIWCSAVFW